MVVIVGGDIPRRRPPYNAKTEDIAEHESAPGKSRLEGRQAERLVARRQGVNGSTGVPVGELRFGQGTQHLCVGQLSRGVVAMGTTRFAGDHYRGSDAGSYCGQGLEIFGRIPETTGAEDELFLATRGEMPAAAGIWDTQ